jgi:hypothetical protein
MILAEPAESRPSRFAIRISPPESASDRVNLAKPAYVSSVKERCAMKLFTIMTGVLGGLALAIASTAPAWAAVPQRGTVVEGHSVPGVALGASRQHVLAAYGKPTFCQSTGEAYCTWQLSNGAVDLTFAGANGGNPAGNGQDKVSVADWIGLSHWRTTAGVTTASALAHPESVPADYPNATVYRYGDGHLYEVLDTHLGIKVQWIVPTYSNTFYVWITIFTPTT